MDSLMGKPSRGAVLKALRNLPQDAYSAYDDAMERINLQDRDDAELAKKALTWVVYARRLLSPLELRHALAVELGIKSLDPDELIDDEVWASLCAGLIVIDEQNNVVRLVRELYTPLIILTF